LRFGSVWALAMLAVVAVITVSPVTAQTKTTTKPAQQNSQAGPSLAETLDFVSRALESYGSGLYSSTLSDGTTLRSSERMTLAQNGSCMLTFIENSDTTMAVGQQLTNDSFALNLADIDPSSVNSAQSTSALSGYSVGMATRNLEKRITKTSQWTDFKNVTHAPTQTQLSQIGIWVSDQNASSRIAHALSHAVELCGGQKSAF